MKTPLTRFVALLLVLPALASASLVPKAPQINASSYVLMDGKSGQVIVNHNAHESLPPASLTKLMTSYIVAEQLDQGNIALDDRVPISVKAWKMGGSRMFIREGTSVELEKLLRGMIVQSGNDATVALAEYVAGSEDAFADLMNQYARQLGMTDSHFVNATGWPAEDHYTSAHDMAILARAIIRDHPDHYSYYAEKSYTYNDIKQSNRNLLLWRDPSVDGLKTGHTEAAGYCLVSSAKKDGMRLVSVVMGTDSEEARARESLKLLTYGFRFYETYEAYAAGETLTTEPLWMGERDQLALGLTEPLVLTIPRDSHDKLKAEMTVEPKIHAPVSKGQEYGTVSIRLQGETLLERPLVALEDVEEAGFFSRLWDHIVLFFRGLFA